MLISLKFPAPSSIFPLKKKREFVDFFEFLSPFHEDDPIWPFLFWARGIHQLIESNPLNRWFRLAFRVYIGDEILPSYIETIINLYKDLWNNQDSMESIRPFFFMAEMVVTLRLPPLKVTFFPRKIGRVPSKRKFQSETSQADGNPSPWFWYLRDGRKLLVVLFQTSNRSQELKTFGLQAFQLRKDE